MSNFNNKSITNKGFELLSAAMASGKLEFTRIVMGNGTYSGDIGVIESLVNQKQSLDIKSITKKGSQVILSTTLLQSAIIEDFYWKEIGVYAKGVDDLEVLYMYGSATDTSFISKDMLNEKMINVGVLVSNAQNVSATIDGSLVYLSRADLEEHNTSNTAHNDIRELIKQLEVEIENIDVSWEGITGKPSVFPPSEHTHTASQITGLPTALPANGGNADTVDGKHASDFIPTSASCNKNWNWSGQSGQPSWLWGGNDATNMYVYNPSNFNVKYATSAGNANTLGGYTLEQIKRLCGGDYVGKQLVNLPAFTFSDTNKTFTYNNSKGGMLKLVTTYSHANLGNSTLLSTLIVDGVTIASGIALGALLQSISSEESYSTLGLIVPFESSVSLSVALATGRSIGISMKAYINK